MKRKIFPPTKKKGEKQKTRRTHLRGVSDDESIAAGGESRKEDQTTQFQLQRIKLGTRKKKWKKIEAADATNPTRFELNPRFLGMKECHAGAGTVFGGKES